MFLVDKRMFTFNAKANAAIAKYFSLQMCYKLKKNFRFVPTIKAITIKKKKMFVMIFMICYLCNQTNTIYKQNRTKNVENSE